MTESDVRLIVQTQQEVYEREVGKPRHDENLLKFEAILAFINKAKGVFLAVTALLGLPALAASCIVIIKFAQGK